MRRDGHAGAGTSATRSANLRADAGAVLTYLGEARNLPAWAPEFASDVQREADDVWLVTDHGRTRRIKVRTSYELGVVDFISADDPEIGAFLRVYPAGPGCHVTFTILFPPESEESLIDTEMTSVGRELANLRDILERS